MNKKERLLLALGDINDKYVKEAEPKSMSNSKRIISIAASLTLIVALSLYLFLPYGTPKSNLSEYESSSYFPVIEKIEAYRQLLNAPKFSNNFESLVSFFGGIFAPKYDMDAAPGAPEAVPDGGANMEGTLAGNGNYIENTDNQVDGVLEGDLMKMTDKYIFRISQVHVKNPETQKYSLVSTLSVYSVAGEDSTLVETVKIASFEGEQSIYRDNHCIYLSADGNTITYLKAYSTDKSDKIGVISLDVSDVENIREIGRVSIDGTLNTTRMVDGRLVIISDYVFKTNNLDFGNPETFVPSIDKGDGAKCIEFDDVIYPEDVASAKYSVVALLDVENLELLGAKALLNFTSDVYVSQNNVYITREYTETNGSESYRKSDIAVLGYRGEALTEEKILTVHGWTKDQYSFDEKEGYLRVVTSTNDAVERNDEGNVGLTIKQNASLYVINLESGETVASVENFAPEGEEATAVRFDGDKCYVCTAVVVTFTDPVFFFDLSDYDNITYTDTGIIEGYSDSLINYGEGILLGIGREDWAYGKVEIYVELEGGGVLGVDEFIFGGSFSTVYKAYLVNRNKNLFGFAVNSFYEVRENDYIKDYTDCYVLITIEGEKLNARLIPMAFSNPDEVRAAYLDGYLYITTDDNLFVEKVN